MFFPVLLRTWIPDFLTVAAGGGAYFGSVPHKRYLAESEKKQNQHRCSHAARRLRRQKVGRKECMLLFKLFLDKKFDKNQGRLASHDNAAHDRRLSIITPAEAKSRNEMLME